MNNGAKPDVLGPLVDLIAERVAAEIGPPQIIADGRFEQWRLWTLEQTAERLTRSERWVREKVKKGELAVVRLDGGALAFDPEEVIAFAQGRRHGECARLERGHLRRSVKPQRLSREWWKAC